jgi:hypothetical protein
MTAQRRPPPQQLQLPLVTRTQRWRNRRESYRPAGEPINPRHFAVDLIAESEAKAFVQQHHYSGSFPAARMRAGLMRTLPGRRSELVGVVVFSQPMTQAVIPHWTGQRPEAGIELGRLTVLDEIPANAESFFVARAFRLLAQQLPQVQAIVSFSDPMRRVTDSGQQITPGHAGILWQALNARHVGRSKARPVVFDRSGRVISDRALAKLRNGERGAGYVYEQLLAAGAPPRRAGEADPDYVARALADGPFRRVRHPGNLAYVWSSLTAPRSVAAGFRPALTYPKPRDVVVAPAPQETEQHP